MKKFLFFFPLGMALLMTILFGTLALSLPGFRGWLGVLIPLLTLSPWVMLSPLMARAIERRTVAAIDALLNNMLVIAEGEKQLLNQS